MYSWFMSEIVFPLKMNLHTKHVTVSLRNFLYFNLSKFVQVWNCCVHSKFSNQSKLMASLNISIRKCVSSMHVLTNVLNAYLHSPHHRRNPSVFYPLHCVESNVIDKKLVGFDVVSSMTCVNLNKDFKAFTCKVLIMNPCSSIFYVKNTNK